MPAAFVVLLVGLPLLRAVGGQPVALFEAFYRAGALVFGGGHVVLPLLHATVVDPGWVSNDQFLAGYGAAQAVPGPLFTFAAYLGAVSGPSPNGVAGATIALVAIFLPSFLLIFGSAAVLGSLRGSAGSGAPWPARMRPSSGSCGCALHPGLDAPSRAGRCRDRGVGALAMLLTGRVPPLVVVAFVRWPARSSRWPTTPACRPRTS